MAVQGIRLFNNFGPVAHLVERSIRIAEVRGSSPLGSKTKATFFWEFSATIVKEKADPPFQPKADLPLA